MSAAAAAAGLAALVAGQAGPQAALPEEIITIPIATFLGGMSGYLFGEIVFETLNYYLNKGVNTK